MGLNLGNTNIGEIYLGNTKIAEAYLGSSLVYSLPSGYDSYIIHLTFSNSDNFNMAGLHVDGVQPSTSDVIMQINMSGNWQSVSSSDIESAINWSNDQGKGFWCDGINITFNSANIPSTVQIKTGTWYGGGSMTVTIHVAGVKDGVETDLGYTSNTNAANLIYNVNI